MNILNLATTDENAAGVACRNVNEMFRKAGFNTVLLVKESASGHPGVIPFKRRKYGTYINTIPGKIGIKLDQLRRRIFPFEKDPKYSFHNVNEAYRFATGKEILAKTPFRPDVVLVFWSSHFVNTQTLHELRKLSGARIILMMTDNAPITGGCHYPWDCTGYRHSCADCPAIHTPGERHIAARNLELKRKYLPPDAEIISSSESDYQRAAASALFAGHRIHKLMAPIDHLRFTPGSKTDARNFFGLSDTDKVIFFGANAFSDPRKGGPHFLQAIHLLREQLSRPGASLKWSDVVLLIAGNETPELFRQSGIRLKEAGYLNEEQLILAYQAADFLVSPSLEDSGPMMLNQSIMCGTPMLAFETGAAMDLVQTGVTGYKAKLGDSADLAAGLYYLLTKPAGEMNIMAANCREFALKNMTFDIYLNHLISIFKN